VGWGEPARPRYEGRTNGPEGGEGYLEARVSSMDYVGAEGGLVIASGVVEGAARYVVGERPGHSGMRWIRGTCGGLCYCAVHRGER